MRSNQSFFKNDHKWTLVKLHNLMSVPINLMGKDDSCKGLTVTEGNAVCLGTSLKHKCRQL